MGLCVSVGILAGLIDVDPEGEEHVRRELEMVNETLRKHGLPDHEEPTSLPKLNDRSGSSGFSYSALHCLRRFFARRIAHPDQIPPPLKEGEKPAYDPVTGRITSPRYHLLWHSDCEGYYVPIDFPEVLEDTRIAGGYIGSSVRLLNELMIVAAPLGIVLQNGQLNDSDAAVIIKEGKKGGPYWIERLVWLRGRPRTSSRFLVS
jgi:hypothetical protein